MTGTRRAWPLLRVICLLSVPWAIGAASDAVSLSALVDHDDDYLYQLPYAEGVDYPVIQTYGSRFTHKGSEFYTIDFAMPEGTAVHAAREGVVVRTMSWSSLGCFHTGCGRFANHVVIEHSDGTTGEYFHLKEGGVLVEEGQLVRRGEPIALSGNTGYSSSPHLHFGVYATDLTDRPRSIEVRFVTSVGPVTRLRVGRRYRNAAVDRFAQR